MKRIQLAAIVLSCGCALGCSNGTTEASERDDVQAVKQEFREAWEALRALAFDRREELETRLDEQVNAWKRSIDELARDTDELASQAREDASQRIEELHGKREQLTKELERLRGSSKDAWSEIRDGLMESMKQMDEALAAARAALESNKEG